MAIDKHDAVTQLMVITWLAYHLTSLNQDTAPASPGPCTLPSSFLSKSPYHIPNYTAHSPKFGALYPFKKSLDRNEHHMT